MHPIIGTKEDRGRDWLKILLWTKYAKLKLKLTEMKKDDNVKSKSITCLSNDYTDMLHI